MKRLVMFLSFLVLAICPLAADEITITFKTGTLNFTGYGTYATFSMSGFTIEDPSPADVLGLTGSISGAYKYSDSGLVSMPLPGGMTYQYAPVTLDSGANQFAISDGVDSLTATISWIDIYTLGTSGGMNTDGAINLTHFSYSGGNTTLQQLAAMDHGSAVLSFTFVPGLTLEDLESDTHKTGYTGTINAASAVPEPGFYSMLWIGWAAVGLFAGASRLKRRMR